MTCAAQAAELLAPLTEPGDSVLDAGCGGGYFYHSLKKRGLNLDYWGVDAAPSLLAIGRREMPKHGLDPARLVDMRIEDLDGECDHVVCINVLSNLDNYHRPLERLLKTARKSLLIRESLAASASYQYVKDQYLDPGVDLKVHVNTYCENEVENFIRSHGFNVVPVVDRRTNGKPEMVIGYPHHWKFLVATRMPAAREPLGLAENGV